jgi:ectoine hydroxylase-related dioxygenase (phytanoyl-CoA dioxygenase family)
MATTLHGMNAHPSRLTEADCRVEDFAAVVRDTVDPADYPYAARVDQGVLIYEAASLRPVIATAQGREQVEAELVRVLSDGPGVVVLAGAFDDHAVVDRVSKVFDEIITAEHEAGTAPGDHFAKPGANSRVWNALEKLALRDPAAFVDYYANDLLALVSHAWLGPAYQVTSQVNVVRPGGVAQDPHRDYHLGFLANEVVERYPTHVHLLSPVLTLQGAVAHSDMPVESGPTMYLPHSHKYAPGYLAWRLPEFRAYFAEHHVQLPLAKGDAAFFNPAVFHGAGTNVSADIQRMANLRQVSSGFGRAMEAVDSGRMSNAVYPMLAARRAAGAGVDVIANAVAATAEGYPFPTNLDLDQPIGGLTPQSQADLLHEALAEEWEPSRVDVALDAYADRRRTHG